MIVSVNNASFRSGILEIGDGNSNDVRHLICRLSRMCLHPASSLKFTSNAFIFPPKYLQVMATDTSAAPTQQAQVSQERTADTPTELPSVTDNNKSSNSQKLDRPAHDNPPSAKDLQKVENYQVRDSKGNSHTFKSLYDGPESPDRVLVIFIRHFFCGVSVQAPC